VKGIILRACLPPVFHHQHKLKKESFFHLIHCDDEVTVFGCLELRQQAVRRLHSGGVGVEVLGVATGVVQLGSIRQGKHL